MPINLDEALGAEPAPVEFSWTSSDVQLYHLGLGAGADPLADRELRYPPTDTPQVLPTFGNVAQTFHDTEPPTVQFPGIDIELSKVLHASEAVLGARADPAVGHRPGRHPLHRHLGQGQGRGDLVGDDGHRSDGTPLWTQKRSIFARGEGGFGGERASTSVEPPDRAPDFELALPTLPQQALLYRMCGDRNPLHSDPEFASAGRLSQADPARAVHLRHRLQGARRRAPRRRCRAGSGPTVPGSPAWCSPARRSRPASGSRWQFVVSHRTRARRCHRAVRCGAQSGLRPPSMPPLT